MRAGTLVLAGLAGAVLAAAGCSAEPLVVPSASPSIVGRVTAVVRSGERIGSVRVEAKPGEASGSDKAVVQITQRTSVSLAGDRADFNALTTGQWVRVWFDGPVMESYPLQATAGTVSIDSVSPRSP